MLIDKESELKQKIVNYAIKKSEYSLEQEQILVSKLDKHMSEIVSQFPITRIEYLECVLLALEAGCNFDDALNTVEAATIYRKPIIKSISSHYSH